MVDRIGQGGSLAKEAMLAALKTQARMAKDIQSAAAEIAGNKAPETEATKSFDVPSKFQEGLKGVNEELRATEKLPEDLLNGKIEDFHEVAVQLRKADLGFKFALEIRNKLLDSYREVMRMHV